MVAHKHVVFGDCPADTTKLGDYNLHVHTEIYTNCKCFNLLAKVIFGSSAIASVLVDWFLGKQINQIAPSGHALLYTLSHFYGEDTCKYFFPESGTKVETWEQFNICTLVPPLTCEIVNECSVI